jgi:hypothetical protein
MTRRSNPPRSGAHTTLSGTIILGTSPTLYFRWSEGRGIEAKQAECLL